MEAEHQAIRQQASGDRGDYKLDARPLSNAGGQGEVFGAVHKVTGTRVALKRRRSDMPDAIARMRREITIGQRLGDEPHVVPILDAAADFSWFVMPIAPGSAETFRSELGSRPDELRRMVEQVLRALEAAHALGWIHRDVKPANILRWEDRSWALGDWGLGRGPQGQTTDPNRTRTGESMGTIGFAAPELSVDAHRATAAADMFSIGQVIGWALTGRNPQPGDALLPERGPWRVIVRAATRRDPSRRPQASTDLLRLMAHELDAPPLPPGSTGERLLAELNSGRPDALADLWALAADHTEDFDLYTDVLPRLDGRHIQRAVRSDPERARDIVRALEDHLGNAWSLAFDRAARVVTFAFHVARTATALSRWDLLEEAAETLAAWDGHWDQWTPQHSIRPWIRSLRGEAARIMAAVLRANPASAQHFWELADDRQVDQRLRAALS